MRQDLKIGMLIGTVFVAAAMIAVAFWPGDSIEARLSRMAGPVPPRSSKSQNADNPAPPERMTDDGSRPTTAQPEPSPRPSVPARPDQTALTAPPPPPPDTPAQATTRYHVVRPGETLSHIAQTYYGSATRWHKIAEANKDILPDPDRVRPGMRLRIPE